MSVTTTDNSGNPGGLKIRGFFRRLTPFDYLVLMGGVINLLVVGFIIGSWLLR